METNLFNRIDIKKVIKLLPSGCKDFKMNDYDGVRLEVATSAYVDLHTSKLCVKYISLYYFLS